MAGEVENSDRAVAARGDDVLAVGAEADVGERVRMTGERGECVSAIHVPHLCDQLRVRGGNEAVARADLQSGDGADFRGDLDDRLAGGGTPDPERLVGMDGGGALAVA